MKHYCKSIGEMTLVGFICQKFPIDIGNCFSVKCDDNKYRKVLNFGYENLKHLIEIKRINFPIEIKIISSKY